MKLIAVDPWDCGCTECITGEYVPLRLATDENIADLLAGRLTSHLHTGTELDVTCTYTVWDGVWAVGGVRVRYVHRNGESLTWYPDAYRAGMAK